MGRPTTLPRIFAGLQVVADEIDDVLHELLALRRALLDEAFDLGVELRIEHREGEVFELPLDGLDAEAMREWGIDLERLGRLACGRLGGDEAPRARIVQPVGELDDEHPDVFRHRDDHLAHRLGLRGVAVLDLVELRDAVDEHRDLVAEVGAHLVERVRGVFDGVVEQRRRHRLRADAEIGEDLRHRDRVGDVGLTALALLPLMGTLSDGVGALDEREVGFRMVHPNRAHQRLDGP